MLEIIKDLYKFNRTIIGDGYDEALDYLAQIIPLNIIKIPSGTKCFNWESISK